jgi:hypothetical protein
MSNIVDPLSTDAEFSNEEPDPSCHDDDADEELESPRRDADAAEELEPLNTDVADKGLDVCGSTPPPRRRRLTSKTPVLVENDSPLQQVADARRARPMTKKSPKVVFRTDGVAVRGNNKRCSRSATHVTYEDGCSNLHWSLGSGWSFVFFRGKKVWACF